MDLFEIEKIINRVQLAEIENGQDFHIKYPRPKQVIWAMEAKEKGVPEGMESSHDEILYNYQKIKEIYNLI